MPPPGSIPWKNAESLGTSHASERGWWLWRDSTADLEVRFVGGGPAWERAALLGQLGEGPHLEIGWLKQVHSTRVREATPGDCGEGDALWTARPDLALLVVTADCVPVLLGGEGIVAAVHAGWRGLAAGVLPAAVAALPSPPAGLTAWLGPAIGPCCYEVGAEVAREVCAAAGTDVTRPGRGERPHLDLGAAAEAQLARAGVTDVRRIALCTRCSEEGLASYRRDGKAAGRNAALIWRRGSLDSRP